MTEVSAIITGHREGVLAGPTLRNLMEATNALHAAGVETEIVAVLDRTNDATRAMFHALHASPLPVRQVLCDFGDPALSRNAGVQASHGRFIAFLDADDLWGVGWLSAALQYCLTAEAATIAHSEVNLVFGELGQLWWHMDSQAPGFDVSYLAVGNYWDAMSFAHRSVYERFPFKANDLRSGYGHEDWHWNCETLAAGIAHRPVPQTMHFKRRRRVSQMSACTQHDVVPWPTTLQRLQASSAPRASAASQVQ